MAEAAPTLAERLAGTPYDAYVYAYPHKTAYGPLTARPLDEVWRGEDTRALSLYIHVPFCEMRCGFCNLFTTPNPPDEVVDRYVSSLERQAARVASALPHAKYARFAVGGGTPTLLEAPALARLMDIAERMMGARVASVPTSVETSPATCTPDRLEVLRTRGVERISIGVQSFIEAESAAVFRPQESSQVSAAIDAIRRANFPVLNIDLIYGLPEQTEASWERSLRTALEWRPEELYLYPLYVRPVTSLSKRERTWDDHRLGLYRQARALLTEAGYEQVSMRMFQRRRAQASSAPVYCVQDDGMVGLGPGARSYTRGLHYSTEWAVGAANVRAILGSWLADDGYGEARWGFALDGDEQRRRWVAYGLFLTDGLHLASYRARFGSDLFDDLPLRELIEAGAGRLEGDRLQLTDFGLERSDTLGPWLYSPSVRARMRAFDVR